MKLRRLGPLAAIMLAGCPVHELRIYGVDAASDRGDAALDIASDRADSPTLDAALDIASDRADSPTLDTPSTDVSTDAALDRPDALAMDAPVMDAPVDRADAQADVTVVDRADVVSTDAATDIADVVTPTAQRSCTDVRTPGCGLVSVPGATLTLGDNGIANAMPLQPMITVSGFRIDRYEVTVARFRLYSASRIPSAIRATPIAYPSGPMVWGASASEPRTMTETVGCNWSRTMSDREAHPINCVDWWTAQEFCVWDGGRLPTEAEWELAARGTDGRLFPWGNATPNDSFVCGSIGASRDDAGVTPFTCLEEDASWETGASPYGAWNMAGNVSELTADIWSAYSSPSCWGAMLRSNPRCALGEMVDAGGLQRVMRGGSYGNASEATFRAANRMQITESYDYSPRAGFRCARGP